jgi:succinyl-CoA synthetase alpha subunit
MNEDDVRARAQALCDALVAGDIDAAIADLSDELRRNLGEVIALLPLPATEATVEAIERGGSSWVVVTRLVGETDEVQIQTRWKDRDGELKVVEASHLSRTVRAEPEAGTEVDEAGGDQQPG